MAPDKSLKSWNMIGIAAAALTILILLSYMVMDYQKVSAPVPEKPITFVGGDQCKACHQKEFKEWEGSHHDLAMKPAGAQTVLGNFDNVTVELNGVKSRFYRKEGKYRVHTAGVGGKMTDFEISHTFGWTPLQQYLVPFEDGRLQCLPIAWDTIQKKWFHLYPGRDLKPEDWLYWTNQAQNWNSMCADCHSTNLKKGYDTKSDRYHTTWSDINVHCESCHGPGSAHMEWAKYPKRYREKHPNGLVVDTAVKTSSEFVEICAPCHSRRSFLSDFEHGQKDMLDSMVPREFHSELYHPDGQIDDEVYVYGSFVQSRMYEEGVICSDCHNSHTLKLHSDGNALCLQCHKKSIYDSAAHHFHKQKGEKGKPIRYDNGSIAYDVGTGAQCIECHMQGKLYMVNDFRRDHSFRIPRPDLTIETGSPNSCNGCHFDQTPSWAAEKVTEWYGKRKRPHFGSIFAKGQQQEPEALRPLIDIVLDVQQPVLVRTTAIALLSYYQDAAAANAVLKMLESEHALLRQSALSHLHAMSPQERMMVVAPLLKDGVKAVRFAAVKAILNIPSEQLSNNIKTDINKVMIEFESYLEYASDFAEGQFNLGILQLYKGDMTSAIQALERSVQIDPDFTQARQQLAVFYAQSGQLERSKSVLVTALKRDNQQADIHFNLGQVLTELQDYQTALTHFDAAHQIDPRHHRALFSLMQLKIFMNDLKGAEKDAAELLSLSPQNIRYLTEITRLSLTSENWKLADQTADMLLKYHPSNPAGQQLKAYLNKLYQ